MLFSREFEMQCFFVEFKCKLGTAYDVAARLADKEVASEIYSVSGEFDLLAKFYVENDQDIGHFVAEHLHTIDGIERTRTMITFRAF